jgi:hypothetical protein
MLLNDSTYHDNITGRRGYKKTKTEIDICKRFETGKKLAKKAYFIDKTSLIIGVPSSCEGVADHHVDMQTMYCGCEDCLYHGKLCGRKFAAMILLAHTVTAPISINESDPMQFAADVFKFLFPAAPDDDLPAVTFATTNPWYREEPVTTDTEKPTEQQHQFRPGRPRNCINPPALRTPSRVRIQAVNPEFQIEATNTSDDDFGGVETFPTEDLSTNEPLSESQTQQNETIIHAHSPKKSK